jgi:hypothetical protein
MVRVQKKVWDIFPGRRRNCKREGAAGLLDGVRILPEALERKVPHGGLL